MAQGVSAALEGRVTGPGGSVLAGAVVTVRAADTGATMCAVADRNGRFRFEPLVPGRYRLSAELTGFVTAEVAEFEVAIGEHLLIRVPLHVPDGATASEAGLPPLPLSTTSELGFALGSDLLRALPTSRDALSAAVIAPGVWPDAVGLAVYGSTGAENSYWTDGLETTDLELGLAGTALPPEFLQQLRVTAAGAAAEYSGSTGGTFAMLARSGGNDFHGEFFGYWQDDSLRSDAQHSTAPPPGFESTQRTGASAADYGFSFGGPLVTDKLWFFAAYDRVDKRATYEVLSDFGGSIPGAPEFGDELERAATSDRYVAKLSWRPDPGQTVSGSFFGDPTTTEGLLPGASLAATPLSFIGIVETGGTDGVVRYDALLGDNVVVDGWLGRHNERRGQDGAGAASPAYIDFTDPLGDGTVLWGWSGHESGFGAFTNLDLESEQYGLAGSFVFDGAIGRHELKVGGERREASATAYYWNGGAGQRIYRYSCDPSVRYCGEPGEQSPYYYRHRFSVASPEVDPYELTSGDVVAPAVSGAGTDQISAYLQDRWQPTAGLTVSLGLRWEQYKLSAATEEASVALEDGWAPRLGVVWDPTGTGRTRLFGHFGRYLSAVPLFTVLNASSGGSVIFTYNLSDDPTDVAAESGVRRSRILSGSTTPVDPNLEAEAMDELVLAAEHRLTSDLMIGIRLIRRNLEQVIEDGLGTDGQYTIGNPGEGVLDETYDLAYAYGYGCVEGSDECHRHRVSPPERRFEGVELVAAKRFSNRWSFLASALYSRLEGDYDGTYQVTTGELQPHMSSAYSYYDFSVNSYGDLASDRRIQLRFDGVYRFDWGLTAGLSAYYRSGVPVTAMGYSHSFNRYLYVLSRRGAFGRTDAEYEADLHLGFPVRLGHNIELELVADIFNLLDRQGETGRDMRFTFDEIYQTLDWSTGEPLPPIEPDDPDRPSSNPSFNTANRWQSPRTIRLGLRLGF